MLIDFGFSLSDSFRRVDANGIPVSPEREANVVVGWGAQVEDTGDFRFLLCDAEWARMLTQERQHLAARAILMGSWPVASLPTRRRWVVRAVSLWVFVLMGACSNSWESDALSARVVDAETGAPIAGAIVVVRWQLTGDYEGFPFGQLEIFERVTDAKGAFQTPAWGPKKTPHRVVLRGEQPVVHVFKRGYVPLTIDNFVGAPGQDHSRAEKHIQVHLNGQLLQLQPFSGSLREYAADVDRFAIELTYLNSPPGCGWVGAPRLAEALSEQRDAFTGGGINSWLPNFCGN